MLLLMEAATCKSFSWQSLITIQMGFHSAVLVVYESGQYLESRNSDKQTEINISEFLIFVWLLS